MKIILLAVVASLMSALAAAQDKGCTTIVKCDLYRERMPIDRSEDPVSSVDVSECKTKSGVTIGQANIPYVYKGTKFTFLAGVTNDGDQIEIKETLTKQKVSAPYKKNQKDRYIDIAMFSKGAVAEVHCYTPAPKQCFWVYKMKKDMNEAEHKRAKSVTRHRTICDCDEHEMGCETRGLFHKEVSNDECGGEGCMRWGCRQYCADMAREDIENGVKTAASTESKDFILHETTGHESVHDEDGSIKNVPAKPGSDSSGKKTGSKITK